VHESLFNASRMVQCFQIDISEKDIPEVYENCLTNQWFQLHNKKSIARKLQLPIDRLLTHVPENSD
jgi:hypothetical protein